MMPRGSGVICECYDVSAGWGAKGTRLHELRSTSNQPWGGIWLQFGALDVVSYEAIGFDMLL